jgi:Mg2+-importing ATPase
MWYYFDCKTPAEQSLFQTAWFVEGLLTQTLIIHMIRSDKIPPIQTRASWTLTSATLTVMGVGIAIPYTPLNKVLYMTPLPPIYYPFLLANLVMYCILTQIAKRIFIRIFKNWM